MVISGKVYHKSEIVRMGIVTDRKNGLTYNDLAVKYNITKSGAKKIFDKFLTTSSVKQQPGQGRKRATTNRENTLIVREAIKNPTTTAADIKESVHVAVSISTIKRRLREAGLQNYMAKKKPLISKRNKAKRLAFAKKYASMSLDFWKTVIWSDESKFELIGQKKRQKVWRQPNQGLQERFLQHTVKHGGGSIMVWGCFSWDGVGNLCQIKGKMTGMDYAEILRGNLKESANKIGLTHFVFQQDNDPKHTSRVAKQYFEEENIEKLEFPPQSPDLNPIEHLWTILDANIFRGRRISPKNFFSELENAWNNLDSQKLKNLVESMPKRLRAVINNHGSVTKY